MLSVWTLTEAFPMLIPRRENDQIFVMILLIFMPIRVKYHFFVNN